MASYPNYNFNTPDALDWDAVEVSLLQMYSDVNAQLGLSTKADQIPYDIINVQMQSRLYDKDNNEDRWRAGLETAYKLLYPFS